MTSYTRSQGTRTKISRRRLGAGLIAMGSLALVSAPKPSRAAPPALTVASQGGSEMQFHKTFIIPFFEKQTGSTVKYVIGAHPDRFVKLRAEVPKPTFQVYYSKYDFVFQAIQLNLLEEISEAIVPGYDQITPAFKTKVSAGAVYTAEGLLYNPKVMERPTSWGAMWDPRFKGKIGLSPFVDRNLMIASLYRTGGQRLDAEKEAWEALDELIGAQKAKVLPGSEQLGQMFDQGEIVLTNFWQARAMQYKSTGSPVDFVAPKEGAISEHWAYGIPRGTTGELKKLAGQYIGIATSDRATIAYAEDAGYPGCKPGVKYPEAIAKTLLTPEEFKALKSPDYAWIAKNKGDWTDKWNRLLTR